MDGVQPAMLRKAVCFKMLWSRAWAWPQMVWSSSRLWYVLAVLSGANYLTSKPYFPRLHSGDNVSTCLGLVVVIKIK